MGGVTAWARTSTGRPLLHVGREQIVFFNSGPRRLRIEVTVENRGTRTSERCPMYLQVAPLGAFVRWRPLTVRMVPAIEPGGSCVVATEVRCPAPSSPGDLGRVPPGRLLTAAGADEEPARRDPRGMARLLARWRIGGRSGEGAAAETRDVPATVMDVLELVGRGGAHWAGNLNVFLGGLAVERHLARALRIVPGRTNVTMFCLGQGRDAYAFELRGSGAAWDTRLVLAEGRSILNATRTATPALEPGTWFDVRGPSLALLLMRVPERDRSGGLEVHVTQRSSGRTAVVEFSLDAGAQGPGCFAID